MIVTITTDASFNKKLEIGTYAFWITSNEGRIKMSGKLRGKMMHSTHCEMACIVNALSVVTMQDWMKSVTRIIINTDSMNAIHLFTKDKKAIKRYRLHANADFKKKSISIVHHFHNTKMKFKFKNAFTFCHVRAHEHTDTARNYVNDWADRMAKEEMSKYIEEKTTKTPTSC